MRLFPQHGFRFILTVCFASSICWSAIFLAIVPRLFRQQRTLLTGVHSPPLPFGALHASSRRGLYLFTTIRQLAHWLLCIPSYVGPYPGAASPFAWFNVTSEETLRPWTLPHVALALSDALFCPTAPLLTYLLLQRFRHLFVHDHVSGILHCPKILRMLRPQGLFPVGHALLINLFRRVTPFRNGSSFSHDRLSRRIVR